MNPDYQREGVTLYCADCRDVLPTLRKVDAVVTDPPYGLQRDSYGTINRDAAKCEYQNNGWDDSPEYIASVVAPVISTLCANDGRVVLTCGRTSQWFYSQPRDVGMFYQPATSSMSYWGRATWQPILFYGRDPYLGKTIHPLHFEMTERPSCDEHPCSKPMKAWTRLTKRCTKDAETILDPFMGSGTTGVACVRLGRKFIGIEIERKYFDIAVRRIEAAFDETSLLDYAAKQEQSELAL